MLEYSTLGELLSGYSLSTLHKRIDQELEDDQRGAAKPYYYGYLAEAYLNSWNKARGRELLDRALLALRPKYDLGLKLHLGALKLAQLEEGSVAYKELASQIYSKAPAMLRNYGLSLPVNYSGLSSVVRSEISQSAFLLDNTSPLAYSIEQSQEGNEVILTFSAQKGLIRNVRVSGQHLPKAIDTLTDKVFSVQLK